MAFLSLLVTCSLPALQALGSGGGKRKRPTFCLVSTSLRVLGCILPCQDSACVAPGKSMSSLHKVVRSSPCCTAPGRAGPSLAAFPPSFGEANGWDKVASSCCSQQLTSGDNSGLGCFPASSRSGPLLLIWSKAKVSAPLPGYLFLL